MEHVDLPRGLDREHVHAHAHDYTLRGSETRTLTTVGAFRVVPANDLRDKFDQSLDPRHGELWHLRDSGLVQTVRLDRDTTAVTLTKEGRDLLESRQRDPDSPERQAFHYGVQSGSLSVQTCVLITTFCAATYFCFYGACDDIQGCTAVARPSSTNELSS